MDSVSQKPVRVPVSLTAEQYGAILAAAEKLGLTISAYIRMAALAKSDV